MEQDSFQCLLLRTCAKVDEAAFELNELVTAANCPPVLIVSDNLTALEQLQLMLDGSDDCLNRAETNGAGIMRHLRMVELRSTVWNQQADELTENVWEDAAALLAENSSDDALNSRQLSNASAVLCKTLRVAHVCYGTTLANVTIAAHPDLRFTRFSALEALIEKLDEEVGCFDAIVVEQSVFEEASVSALSKLKQYLPLIPSVVLTLEKSDFSALSYLERGFTDCVTADSAASTSLLTAIRKAVVRRRRALMRSLSEQQVGPNVSDRRSSVRSAQNRRRHVRFFTERSLIAIPVLPNGAPDIAGRCNATSVDVSLGGIGVKIPDREQLAEPRLDHRIRASWWRRRIRERVFATSYVSGGRVERGADFSRRERRFVFAKESVAIDQYRFEAFRNIGCGFVARAVGRVGRVAKAIGASRKDVP